MKKIIVFITTYNRPELLQLLLRDIHEQARGYHLSLMIIDDHSSADYQPLIRYLEDHFKGRYHYQVNPEHYGKKYYWKTVSNGYEYMAGQRFDYFIQMQDDIRLTLNFFREAIKIYDCIHDPDRTVLSLYSDISRLMKPFWTHYRPRGVSFGEIDLVRTGWIDMCCLISTRKYLHELKYTLNPIDSRWSGCEGLSSGVGMQISQRLIADGHSIYSVKRSLVIHDHHPSMMHPAHREETKLISNHNMDKIIATMATIPGREESMEAVVRSIIDQVDELRIYANNITEVPKKYQHRKVKWLFSVDHAGDLGDAGKFYGIEDILGYHFTIDDDLIYPQDYVAEMISTIERYERRCVVSLHGRTFPAGHIRSYYHGAINRYSCLRSVPRDVFAHVIGTGVLAYHTDTIRVPFEIFEAANMADIWFSRYCQEQHVPRLVMKHAAGWVKDSPYYDQYASIYFNNHNDETLQTQVMNSIQWTLP